MFEVKIIISDGMFTRRDIGGSAARKKSFRVPRSCLNIMRFKESDWKKRNVVHPGDLCRIDGQVADIFFVHGIVNRLKLKQLQCNIAK